jgi:hypothetical protein
MHEHLEECLVTDPLARRYLSRLFQIRSGSRKAI